MSIARDFNVIFETTGKLCDIAKKVNQLIHKETQQDFSKLTENDGHHSMALQGVVYKAICRTCLASNEKAEYIGETGRLLEQRMKEHFRPLKPDKIGDDNSSAIAQHCLKVHGSQPDKNCWNIIVLHKCLNTQDRRALEALEIRHQRPCLNRDSGVQIIIPNVDSKFKIC